MDNNTKQNKHSRTKLVNLEIHSSKKILKLKANYVDFQINKNQEYILVAEQGNKNVRESSLGFHTKLGPVQGNGKHQKLYIFEKIYKYSIQLLHSFIIFLEGNPICKSNIMTEYCRV